MSGILSKIHWVIIFIALFDAGVFYFDHQEKVVSIESELPIIQARLKDKTKKAKQLKTFLKDIEAAKERIEIVALEVEKIQKKLPNIISDTENLGTIKNIAEDLNIKNIFLTPSVEVRKGFYITKKYELKSTGTFLQFLIFFEKIASNERLLNIGNFKIYKSQNKQRGRFQMINLDATIEAYKFNSAYREKRGINEIELEFKKTKKSRKRKSKRKRKS